MILTCLRQRKSGTFRRWGRLSISSGDSLCFSAKWYYGCDEQVFLLDGVSEWKDVSIAWIAEEDNFLSFILICSIDDEESEDSADTLSNLLFGFNQWIFPGPDKKDFRIGFFTGEHKEPVKILFLFDEFFGEDVTLENDTSGNVGSCRLIFPKVNSRNITLNNSSSSIGLGFKKSPNK